MLEIYKFWVFFNFQRFHRLKLLITELKLKQNARKYVHFMRDYVSIHGHGCSWPALRWGREITSLTMFHKLLHSRPEPLSECLFQYASATSARSRRKPFQLLLPHTRTTRYRESFFYRSALLRNSLPHDIQSLKNSKSFRNALENHYQSYKFTTTENFHIPLSSAFS